MEIADAQLLFSPEPAYLNTATYGLPPRDRRSRRCEAAADEWRHGRTGFDGWDESVGRGARARSRGSRASARATSRSARQVSRVRRAGGRLRCRPARGCSRWRATSRACCSRSSRRRRAACAVELVPLERLAEAIAPHHDVVAFSACRAPTGGSPTSTRSLAAAAAHGVRTFVDTTQATGWLPLDHAPLRLRRVRGLQVAAEPARDRVLHAPAGAARRAVAARRRLVRGRGRRRAPTTARRCGSRRTRAASTSRRRGTAGSARRRRSSCSPTSGVERDPRARPRAREPAARRARAWRRATRRSCRSAGCRTTRPTRLAAARRDGGGARRRAAALLPPLHDGRRTSTARWRSCAAGRATCGRSPCSPCLLVGEAELLHHAPRARRLSGSVKETTSSSPSGPKASSTEAAPSSVARPWPQRSGIDGPADLDLVAPVDRRGLRAAAGDELAGRAVEPRVPAEAVLGSGGAHARDLLVDLRRRAAPRRGRADPRVAEQGDAARRGAVGRSARRACGRW